MPDNMCHRVSLTLSMVYGIRGSGLTHYVITVRRPETDARFQAQILHYDLALTMHCIYVSGQSARD